MAKQTDAPLQTLKRALQAGTPERCYLFWGEESYLLRHYLGQLQKNLVDSLTEEFNFHRLNQESFSLDTLLDSVENLPMLAERTLVVVEDVDLFRLAEQDRERLIKLLWDLPEHCCLVFVFDTIAYRPDRRQKKLYEALERNASSVEFARQNQRDLTAWISRHMRALGKDISQALCVYLMERTGGDMTALAGEIGKIAAYAAGPEITRQDIDAVTEPVLEAVVFEMTDALGAGAYEDALGKLEDLFLLQQEPIAILGAIGAQLRRLSAARTLLDAGKGETALMQLCSLRDFVARKTMSAARRLSPEFCRVAANLVVETDAELKTSFDDPKRLLELLICRLAQEAQHA